MDEHITLDLDSKKDINIHVADIFLIDFVKIDFVKIDFVKINLSNNNLDDRFIYKFFNFLHSNTTLQDIDLSCNNITCHGANMITSINKLQYNNTIVSLILSNNDITDGGIRAFNYARKNGMKNLILLEL